MSGFLIFGILGNSSAGYKNRFNQVIDGEVGNLDFFRFIEKKYFDCQPKDIAITALMYKGFLRCKQSKRGAFEWLLIGDSHAEHLFLGLADAVHEKNIAYYIQGAAPYYGKNTFKPIFDFLASTSGKKTILLTTMYVARLDDKMGLEEGLKTSIKFLKNHGHRVILLADIPSYNVSAEVLKYGASLERYTKDFSISRSEWDIQRGAYETILERLAVETKVPLIRIHEPLCDESGCSMLKNNTVLYRDTNHLNIPGSILVGNYLAHQIKNAINVGQ